MVSIDARGLSENEIFKTLKDVFSSGMGLNNVIEVLLPLTGNYKKVLVFAEMSGCKSDVVHKEDGILIRLTDCCPSCG